MRDCSCVDYVRKRGVEMKAVVFSLGCKVNTYEGQAIISFLEANGIQATDKPCYADAYIINTCSVTAEADKKSRQAVERMRKYNRNARILVIGCSSQNDGSAYRQKNVSLSGVGGKIQSVAEFLQLGVDKNGDFTVDLPLTYEEMNIPKPTRTRGYIKIQDGCNNFCSYCRIPYLRGRSRSRKIESIVEEAKTAALHSKEIVLTGINISDYRDGENGLTELVYALKDVCARKRFGSLECEVIDDKLLSAMKECGFCDHFHLSLQSGSDAVLKRMNRRYTARFYQEKCESVRKYFPAAAITTDIITGFPLESESEFEETCEFVEKIKFAALHAFPYSERKGTAAYSMPQIDKRIRSERAGKLIEIGKKLADEFIRSHIGSIAEVYAEESKDGISEGYTSNYIKVYSSLKPGELAKVKLTEVMADGAKGEIV